MGDEQTGASIHGERRMKANEGRLDRLIILAAWLDLVAAA